jgi:hypothetical protein
MSNELATQGLSGDVIDRADAPTVAPTVASLPDVLDRMRAEAGLAETRSQVEIAHRGAFADMCATTYAALKSGVTVKSIVEAAKAAGLPYASNASVQGLGNVGQILTLGGDMPEGVEARDFLPFFSARARINGQDGIRVQVTAPQLSRLMAREPRDVAAAYKALAKIVRENRDAKQAELDAVAKAARALTGADDDDDVEAAPVEATAEAAPVEAEAAPVEASPEETIDGAPSDVEVEAARAVKPEADGPAKISAALATALDALTVALPHAESFSRADKAAMVKISKLVMAYADGK